MFFKAYLSFFLGPEWMAVVLKIAENMDSFF